MGTLLLNQIKKQASCFLHEKYKTARLALTSVTEAELLAEEATNNDPWGPDAKTMTTIAGASYQTDDYWRIAEILHSRLDSIDWKQWRQSYKSLVLLEFLITHGPAELAAEFQSASDVIEELGTFQYVDEKGFNWGENMQKRSQRILELLKGGEILQEARFKALKITKEIQGYGNSMSSSPSPSSSSSSPSSSSSFGSYSDTSDIISRQFSSISTKDHDIENYSQEGIQEAQTNKTLLKSNEESEESHLWNCPPIQEKGSLLDSEDDDDEEEKKQDSCISSGGYSKLAGNINPTKECQGEKFAFRSFSDIGRLIKKKYDRQFSLGY